MKIGEAAKETGLSISNIRFYERKGLLCPRRKEESQYREYEPEDIRRLKEIMLLRKMGISVESIYLLYEGQTELLGLLERQEKELAEQMEMLQGSLELCRMLKEEGPLSELNVDEWLQYVHKEEESGKRFAAPEEFLEDLAEYSGFAVFRADPHVGRLFRRKYAAELLAAAAEGLLFLAAVSSILSGGGVMGRAANGFWVLYLLGFGIDFFWFRKRRQKEKRRL